MSPRPAAAFILTLVALSACSPESGASPPSQNPDSNAAEGRTLFHACTLCHIAAPPGSPAAKQTRVGPNLWGVFGRPSAAGVYNYSPAMRRAGLVWDEETLNAFIAHPAKIVPGSRMSFLGEPDPEKRQAIIDYLKTLR